MREILLAALAGLVASVLIEQLMAPRPKFSRPWGAWSLHGGLCLLAYGALVLLIGRPWFAAAAVSAFLLLLVLVSNAKVRALREPFIVQDWEYFTYVFRYPRFYIPYLGWARAGAAALMLLVAVAWGFWWEQAPAQRLTWGGQLGAIAALLVVGGVLTLAGSRQSLPVSLQPLRDLVALGLLASMWRYAVARREGLRVSAPFATLAPCKPTGDRPHLVAVQSESFFDPRPLHAGIRPEVLKEMDGLKAEAMAHGKLAVPAWGAYTVRTEFAFLSGLDEAALGVHRFNPYRAVADGAEVQTLATYLKRLGYRTVCIHPYPAGFYRRDLVYPKLGFDEFVDLRAFDGAARCGPYVSDAAVTEMIVKILSEATGPVFIFAITMENHGPLHMESASAEDVAQLYDSPPPPGCAALTVYLRHLRNADRMLGDLRCALTTTPRPASLCWFGDHAPIMPGVYAALGQPRRQTQYLLWPGAASPGPGAHDLAAHQLAARWLQGAGLAGP